MVFEVPSMPSLPGSGTGFSSLPMRQPTPTSLTAIPLPTWAWVLIVVAQDQIFGIGRLSFWHWNIAAGMFFASLWLAPKRAWWWMVLMLGAVRYLDGQLLGWSVNEGYYSIVPLREYFSSLSLWLGFVGCWGDLIACVWPAWWLRRRVMDANTLATPGGTVWLHLADFAAALCQCNLEMSPVCAS